MPRALSSVLAGARTPQPRSLGILNPVDFMDSLSNYYLEPAVFKSRVLIGQRAGSNFHSIPRELIVSRASVSRGNNSNCFHGKQFWARSRSFLSRALNWLDASPG